MNLITSIIKTIYKILFFTHPPACLPSGNHQLFLCIYRSISISFIHLGFFVCVFILNFHI